MINGIKGIAMYKVDTEAAVRQYADMVYRLAYVNAKNEPDAEDIFQEVFLRLLKYQDKIENEEHLKAWLIRVTVNCCHKHFSSLWKRKIVPLEQEIADQQVFEIEEKNEDVIAAIKQLSPLHRNIIHLHYYEGYTCKEIAAMLDKSESSIKTGAFRAREVLRGKLEGSNW